MVREASQLERFLGAVHRRMVLVRLVERVGVCVLAGCGVALLLMPILVWRAHEASAMQLVMGCLGLGFFAGLVWGVSSRPNRLAAAVEADRQLRLADLLGTALYLRRAEGDLDEMGRTVLAIAEARCAATSPSAVILNRIGARGWGGIGLAAALAVTVGLAGGSERVAEANAAGGAEGVRSWKQLERRDENVTRIGAAPDVRRARPGAGGDDDDALAAPWDLSKPDGTGGEKGNPGASMASQDGTGGGSAGSRNKSDAGQSLVSSAGGGGTAVHSGAASSGGTGFARSEGDASGGGGAAGNAGGGARRAAPVWASEQWAEDREAALRAVRGGGVPDAYRELVREYFERR